MTGAMILALSACGQPDQPAAAADPAADEGWQIFRVKDDKLDKATVLEAEATLTADSGRPFDLAVRCSPGFVTFKFDNYDKNMKFEVQNAANGEEAYFLPAKLDDGDVRDARSEIEYHNEATIFFYDPDIAPRAIADGVSDQYGHALKAASSDTNGNAVGQAVGGLVGVFAGLFSKGALDATAAGTVGDLLKANRLSVEVPLADGGMPLLKINLRDEILQNFLGHCAQDATKAYPPPPAASDTADGNAASNADDMDGSSNQSQLM